MMLLVIALTFLIHLPKIQGAEETGLLAECDSGSYRCADNSKCVLQDELCNYHKDCDDFSDERLTMCRIIRGKQGSCKSFGVVQYTDYPDRWGNFKEICEQISKICDQSAGLFREEYREICNQVDHGLLPFEEIAVLKYNVSTLLKYVEMYQNESKLKDVFQHLAASFDESNLAHNDSDCPPFYVNITGRCTSLFVISEVPWAKAKQFCESISGTLANLRKMKDYDALMRYLKKTDFTANFWIGGLYNSKSVDDPSWKWLNNKEIVMGAPYWSLYQTSNNCSKRGTSNKCYQYALAPRENKEGMCVAMDYDHHYYFTDQNCQEERSPLCFLNEK